MKKSILLMAISLFGLTSCKASRDLDAGRFAEALGPSARIVDVRTEEEFEEGHLRGAVNVNWNADVFLDRILSAFDKSSPLYVYCRSGRRSAEAAAALTKAGYEVFNLKGGYLAWTGAGMETTRYEVERFSTDGGKTLEFTLIKHGSLEIRYGDLSIQVDPVAEYGKYTDYGKEFPKADVILVTHEHPDHLHEGTIASLSGENSLLILNGTSRERIGRGEVISNGESRTLPGGIRLEAVPAYNTTPGREMFHPKGNGNGYVLEMDGFRVYVAGDTEDIPEMGELKDIDLAFLPVNQPFTMTVEQCVKAARAISPRILIPYHFGMTDISSLPSSLPETDVRLRQMQ